MVALLFVCACIDEQFPITLKDVCDVVAQTSVCGFHQDHAQCR